MTTRKPAKPKSQRNKTPAEIEPEKKRQAEARRAAAERAKRDEDESEHEDEADRDEDEDEARDGGEGKKDDDADADDQRDGDDDDAEDDEDRDGDDDADEPKKDDERAAGAAAKRAAEAEAKGYRVQVANFLQVQPNPVFDYVLMNPPFVGKHYQKHVEHARKFLKPGGTVLAILPVTAVTDHNYIDPGRGWDRWKDLPVGAFSESGTNINTGIAKFFAT